MRRFLKYLFIIFGLVVLLPLVIYIPSVQDFVSGKAVEAAERATGMRVSLDEVSLRFPLRFGLEGVVVAVPGGDTVFSCREITLGVALLPLFKKEVEVTRFRLRDAGVNYADSTAGFGIMACVGELSLRADRIYLGRDSVNLPEISLSGAKVSLALSPQPDTTSGGGFTWKFNVATVTLENIAYDMTISDSLGVVSMSAYVGRGVVRDGSVDLAEGEITASSLEVLGSSVSYTAPGGKGTAKGFDPANIAVSGLTVRADSIYSRGPEIAATIKALALTERSGLEISGMKGGFRMDSTGYDLHNMNVRTSLSSLSADGHADAGVFRGDYDAKAALKLTADVDFGEILDIYDIPLLRKIAGRMKASVVADASGTLAALDLRTLALYSPRRFDVSVSGKSLSLAGNRMVSGELALEASLWDISFLEFFLRDAALDKTIAIPRNVTLAGTLRAAANSYAANLSLSSPSLGRLDIDAGIISGSENYNATIRGHNFDIGRMVKIDTIGRATFELHAHGQGFRLLERGNHASADMRIASAYFRRHDYRDVVLSAGLDGNRAVVKLDSRDNAATIQLKADGIVMHDRLNADVKASVDSADLYRLGFSPSPLVVTTSADLHVAAVWGRSYLLQGALQDMALRTYTYADTVDFATIGLRSDDQHTNLEVKGGDLDVAVDAGAGIMALGDAFGTLAAEISQQAGRRMIDVATLASTVPPFSARITAGRLNPLSRYLSRMGIDYHDLTINALSDGKVRTDVRVIGLQSGSVTVDSVSLYVMLGDSVRYDLRLANAPFRGNENLALVTLSGYAVGNIATANLRQQNRSGQTGMAMDLAATLHDTVVRLEIASPQIVLGYSPWNVTSRNYIDVYKSGRLSPDIELSSGRQRIAFAPHEGADEEIKLLLQKVDLAGLLRPLPEAPPLEGVLSASFMLEYAPGIALKGELTVDSMRYNRYPLGDISAGASYGPDTGGSKKIDLKLLFGGVPSVMLSGRYDPRAVSSLSLSVDVPSLPLSVANAFIPDHTVALDGALKGGMRIVGTPSNPLIDGELYFDDGRIVIPMAASRFLLDNRRIAISRSRLTLDNFMVTAADKSTLSLDGWVDMSNTARIETDVRVRATDFQVVNVPRGNGTELYGKAYVDLEASASGRADALKVRGQIHLLGGTDVVYVVQDSPLEVKSRSKGLLEFISFADSIPIYLPPDKEKVNVSGMDVLASVEIDPRVQMSMLLTPEGSDKITLGGGGTVTYSLDRQGNSRFAGRYVLDGGTVSYAPPLISAKEFAITPGSFVEWGGEIANPTVDIKAVETLRSSVSGESQDSRQVTFNVIILITGQLEELAVAFDIAAPDDITLGNQIASMTPQQRATQAMNMLIYNTYTGPGTSAKVNSSTAVNAFIEKELNTWAQNTLKNVDLAFGIDTYGVGDEEGRRTDYSYKVSKNLFGDRVKAVVGGRLSTGDDVDENMAQDIVDDISVEYQVSKRENMVIKAFRHTDYENIVEGEVTQTGFGWVVRKKLRKLADMFRSSKKEVTAEPVPAAKPVEDER